MKGGTQCGGELAVASGGQGVSCARVVRGFQPPTRSPVTEVRTRCRYSQPCTSQSAGHAGSRARAALYHSQSLPLPCTPTVLVCFSPSSMSPPPPLSRKEGLTMGEQGARTCSAPQWGRLRMAVSSAGLSTAALLPGPVHGRMHGTTRTKRDRGSACVSICQPGRPGGLLVGGSSMNTDEDTRSARRSLIGATRAQAQVGQGRAGSLLSATAQGGKQGAREDRVPRKCDAAAGAPSRAGMAAEHV
jgi:hypothetical protein